MQNAKNLGGAFDVLNISQKQSIQNIQVHSFYTAKFQQ